MANQKNKRKRKDATDSVPPEETSKQETCGVATAPISKRASQRPKGNPKAGAMVVPDEGREDLATKHDEVVNLALSNKPKVTQKHTVFDRIKDDQMGLQAKDSTLGLSCDTDEEANEEEEEKSKKAGHPKTVAPETYRIYMMVPVGTDEDGVKERVSVMSSASFSEALEEIHVAIGCQDINEKPSLKYKIGRNGPIQHFLHAGHWDTLKEDYRSAVKSRKTSTILTVEIKVDDKYLLDLHHTLKLKISTLETLKGKKKGTKIPEKPRNLNALSDESEEVEEGSNGSGYMDQHHREAMELLKSILGPCEQKSCHNERCKINKKGTHVDITWNLLRQWVEAMVAYKQDPTADPDDEVSEKKPPRFGAFLQFYSDKLGGGAAVKSPSPEPVNNPAGLAALGVPPASALQLAYLYPQLMAAANGYQVPAPGGFPLQAMMPPLPIGNTPQIPGSSRPEVVDCPSSDGLSVDISFPSILEFFDGLKDNRQGAQRNLEAFKDKFLEQKIIYLDELKGLTTKDYIQDFNFLFGNAHFIEMVVTKEIHRIEKAHKVSHQIQHS
ncbi:hypothetical protein M422DRAFT_260739 [Sphaerobolus stellatus SS14]|uniref:Uncharacterized protein n=1 Tax=Sphaerobolus stellatus (strain SS14) TaxID=990650 RepID=A0A0C9U271_SPHS4|nr:hypothetical protein M422DRAFT_260739 [Sphaerobolus stellatus SS14]